MKAVIVECSNNAAVALCDDGTFRKLKNKGYSIGQELLLKQKITPNHMVQKLSICASLALVLLSCLGIGSYSYVKPYSYVSLDINPSIEYALNRYDKVISVSGINDKGQQIVSSIESDIKNQNITTALGITIKQLAKENYIDEQGYNHVIVSICSTDETKAQSIASCVDTFSVEESQVCSIDTMTVSKEVKNDADLLGITPAKLALINAVAETTSASNFDISEWTDLTVSELETTIQQASSKPADSAKDPSEVTVIDSEYLSSALDDNTANNSDSTAAASLTNADTQDTQNGSTITDKQPSTTDDATIDSNASESVSTSKQDNAANATIPSAADSSASDNKNNQSDSTGKTPAEDVNNGSVADVTNNKGDVSNQDIPSSKPNPDKNSGNSSGGTAASGSDSADTADIADSTLTEEISNKKDSYPLPNTDTLADSSNPAEEQADSPVSNPAGEQTDLPDSDEETAGAATGLIENTVEPNESSEPNRASTADETIY